MVACWENIFEYTCSSAFAAGEIFDYLLANGRLKERDVRIKFRQVIFGLILQGDL